MSSALDVVTFAVAEFFEKIYTPLFEFFDLGKIVLLLVMIYLSVRFLLAPLMGGRAIEKGEPSNRESVVTTPQLEKKGD